MKKKIYLGGRMSGKSFLDDKEELTPREAWEEIKRQIGSATYIRSDLGAPQITTMLVKDTGLFEIIERAFNRLEFLEKADSSFILFCGGREAGKSAHTMSICNKLKSLEIIKEYPEQLLDIIDTNNYNEYLDLDYAPNQYMSEQNYYLLKEVLCSENY